jgi:hypothetical protein
MKKWLSVWLCLTVLGLSLTTVDIFGQLLIRRPVFDNPETWVINKSYSNARWNKDVYCQVTSSALAYVGDPLGNLAHVIDIEADACWNRLIYSDQQNGQASRKRAYGIFGEGVDSLFEPMAVKVISPTSDQYWNLPYYNIYVADRGNHRVQKLRYRWTTPDSGLIHVQYLTSQLWRPTDLDVSNNGTYDFYNDDVIWVACKSDKIVWFFEPTGYCLGSYGSTGSDIGQFSDIRAIVCGKTREANGVWFANNRYIIMCLIPVIKELCVCTWRPSYP